MKSILTFLAAAGLAATVAGAAHADGPGKKPLQPYQPPSHTTYTVPSQVTHQNYSGYEYSYSSTTESDLRNQAESQRLQSIPVPQPRVIYTQPAPAPSYQYTQTAPPVQRYVPQPAPPVQHYVPAPAPTYQPCGPQGYTHSATAGCGAPPVHHAPVATQCPHMQGSTCQSGVVSGGPAFYRPQLQMNPCGDKVIERLSDTRDGRHRYSVCYADLNHLAPYDRNMTLLDRMEKAADKACKDFGSSILSSLRARQKCEAETLEEAVYDARLPGLADAYRAKTGKRTPDVHVGRPIMN